MRSLVRYRFLLLVPVVLLATSFKPIDDYTISVIMRPADAFDRFSFYSITGNSHKSKITYLHIDSVYYLKMFKDTAFLINQNRYKNDTTTAGILAWSKNYDNLLKTYSKHTEKVIEINSNKQRLYFKQIDSLLNAPENILLYKSPKYPSYMDGATYYFDVNSGGKVRKFQINNPDNYFAAPLYRLLSSVWGFLDPKKK